MAKRYIYLMLILNMLTNIVAYIPKILAEERGNGSILAILFAVPVGLVLIYFFTRYLSKFPNEGMPEILKKHTPTWFRFGYLLFQGTLWCIAGMITLVAFTNLAKQYINPDMSELLIIFAFLVIIVFGALMPSNKVLYATEIILLLNVPFILFFIFKAYVNENIVWDSMRVAATHYRNLPNYEVISATTYVFTGYANLTIFNRCFKEVKLKFLWMIGLIGLFTLCTSFFIPIGYHGFDGVGNFTFPGISTSEALRIELGFVERVSFIFLALYINISLASVILHWHVGIELIKSIFPKIKVRDRDLSPFIIALIFSLVACLVQTLLIEETVSELAKIWLMLLLPSQVFGILLLKWIIKRKDLDAK